MSAGPLVVEALRGDVVESRHLIDVAVVDDGGTLVSCAGDPETIAYLRSSAKPIQASVCLDLGWEPRGTEQLAVACASHNAEPVHLEVVRSILADAGIDEAALRCPVVGPGSVHHNCSGKHAAMLATCGARGWDLATYTEPGSEMQRAVRVRIEAVAGRPPRATSTDGCGVPTFAFTLIEAATVFSRLPAQTPRALDAMRAHPFLVAGSHRICTSVMSGAKEVVMKVGAEGLMCGALADRRLAFALKTRDGSGRGREIATLRILELLGVLRDDLSRSVLQDIEPLIRTGQGRQPSLRCIGDLERA